MQGPARLFTGEFGFEIGWLVPAALLALVLVLAARGRAPRTDLVRAGALLFGGWLLVDGLVLSYMRGMVHPYYCLSLAPAVAALFAIGVREMWARRASAFGRWGLLALVLSTGIWSCWILRRNAAWLPALRWTILALTVLAAAAMLLAWSGHRGRAAAVATAAGLVGALAGSAVYAVATIDVGHRGGGPTVGPGTGEGPRGAMFGQIADNPQLDGLLSNTHTTWSAATVGSSPAAAMELTTRTAVLAVGGFGGRDPAPTLDQFTGDVAAHRVAYFVVRGNGHGGWGHGRSDITDWVGAHFTATKAGDATVYDLSRPK